MDLEDVDLSASSNGHGSVVLLRRLLEGLGVPGAEIDERLLAGSVEALRHYTRGYHERPEDVLGEPVHEPVEEPVVVRDIPFVSPCREHLLPFHGSVHVAYLPGDAVVGLPRLTRLVDVLARRLQTPTRLADDVARALHDGAGAKGVAVRVEACEVCPGAAGRTTAHARVGDFRRPFWRERLEGLL